MFITTPESKRRNTSVKNPASITAPKITASHGRVYRVTALSSSATTNTNKSVLPIASWPRNRSVRIVLSALAWTSTPA